MGFNLCILGHSRRRGGTLSFLDALQGIELGKQQHTKHKAKHNAAWENLSSSISLTHCMRVRKSTYYVLRVPEAIMCMLCRLLSRYSDKHTS